MATYEYKCTNKDCGHVFTMERSMKEEVRSAKCERCDKDATRYFSSAPAFDSYFQGSYKSENPPRARF